MIKVLEFDIKFLNKSWEWLNDEDLQKLIISPRISKKQQEEWFYSLKNKKNYYIKGIEYNGEKIGVLGLKNITQNKGEYFGYIGEREYWGLGIGKFMLKYIEEYCKKIKLKKIYLKVLKNNKRAFLLYKRFGYKIIEVQESIYIMEKDVI